MLKAVVTKNGLRKLYVMQMAGHASFETTHKFCMSIRDDLIDRTRQASVHAIELFSVIQLLHPPDGPEYKNDCHS